MTDLMFTATKSQLYIKISMKLRIKGNSVRFRLTKTEVKNLSEGKQLKEQTEFSNPFFYSVVANDGIDNLKAEFKDNGIILYIPSEWSELWDSSERIGFDADFKTPEGKKIFLLIEKDFKCLEETTEDQTDNYENPNMSCSNE